jgi:tyrosyl-tRNA synthetase
MLVDAGMVKSNSEARRLIEQGGVSIDGQRVNDPTANITLHAPVVLKAGKRQFARISGS